MASAASSNNGSGSSAAAAAAMPKNLGYVGARHRPWGRWAAELRMPRSRDKMWIGTFATPKEAAHAYDAAIFCFYGHRIPKARKINFPTAPRPDIPENVRVGLTVASIKAIAEEYARRLAEYVPPPLPLPELPAVAPLMVEAAAASANGGGAAPATNDGGNVMMYMGEDITTIADCLLSINTEELDPIDLEY
ncbi:hypothetical protein EJB05_40739, partial [Eragrostis curvula]